MEKNKFEALMPVIVGGLVGKIIEDTRLSDFEAFEMLYNSALYAALEDEEKKVWTYSVPKLYFLLQEELKSGKLELPDY